MATTRTAIDAAQQRETPPATSSPDPAPSTSSTGSTIAMPVGSASSGSPLTSLPVEHLCTIHVELTKPVVMPDGPDGGRLFVAVLDGTVVGERINGRMIPFIGSAWVTLRDDHFASVHVTGVIRTDDHATIAYTGTGIAFNGPQPYRRMAVRFEAGRDDYRWLNNLQAVALGTPGRDEATWDFYALR